MINTPSGLISCDKCEEFHEQNKLTLPCSNYKEGDEYLFYDNGKHPLCHIILEPDLTGDNLLAFNLWSLVKNERVYGEAPNTLKSLDIVVICQLYDVTIEIFEKIKMIESIYFHNLIESHNDHVKEIKSKHKK